MKKILCVLIVAFILVGVTACGKTSSELSSSEESRSIGNASDSEQQRIQADVGLLTVTIQYSANLIEMMGNTADEMVNNMKTQEGVIAAIIDPDGNVVVTVTKEKHRQMLEQIKDTIDNFMLECVENDTFPSIKAIEANDNYSVINVTVDKAAFEVGLDSMMEIGLKVSSVTYLAIAGENDPRVEINYIDETTGEIFKTYTYPDGEQD